jgi:hypothetical protein
VPVAGAASIVEGAGRTLLGPEVGIVGALTAWRVTQGIYVVDPQVFDALWETPLTGELPHQLLHHLPEWCVYIACPQPRLVLSTSHALHGFYVHLEWDVETHEEELRFLLDTTTTLGPTLIPLAIHLGEWDLQVACQRSLGLAIANLQRQGDAQQAATLQAIEREATTLMREVTEPLTSLTLYLCSVAADVRDSRGTDKRPTRPQPVKTKQGTRLFGASQPTTWEVGYRLGSALRLAAQTQVAERPPAPGEGVQRRAHIRRAHWHLYWTGRGRLVPKVHWLHPILVAAERGAVVPTIHQVD